jgi:PAS domain-containing protein
MTAVVGLRYALYLAYLQAPRPPAEARTWARRFVAGAGATGLIWGFLASALYPASSMLHQFFVIFVIGGMALSAMVILAPVRQAFLAYMLPLMALTTAAVLSQGGNLHLFMGVLLIVFAGVMLVASPVLSDMMRESVRVKFENSGLVERISQVNLDLSERAAAQQRADEELRQSERRYRYLFESNPVPMWIRDEGTMSIQAVNAAALQTYGYARDEFLRL